MSSVSTIAQWQREVQESLPSLSRAQAQVLGLWSYAIVLVKSCGITQVSNWLANVLDVPRGRLRQRLREWDYEARAKRGRKRREVRVQDCFAELLTWVIAQWQGEHRLALALDATTLGERFTVLCVSVVYRGCAIPVAWRILRAKVEGEWRGPIEALFAALQGVIPTDWQVIVMADRGLYAPWLYQTIQRLGWHPVLRVKEGMSFRAEAEEQARPIGERVRRGGRKWAGRGVWSEQGTPMGGTLVVCWEQGYEEKLAVVTDLEPEEVEGAWYQMRFWIEDEFKDEKRGGWHWEQTKMTDPERAQRRWLAMAVATQWVVKVGGEQEAKEPVGRGKKPQARRKVGRPARQFHRPRGRERSCFMRGQQAISAALAQGRPLPPGRLVAESWPTKLYAVGKPPSSWVKKRKHKAMTKRQRKSKQAEARRQQQAEQREEKTRQRAEQREERRRQRAAQAEAKRKQQAEQREEKTRQRAEQREERQRQRAAPVGCRLWQREQARAEQMERRRQKNCEAQARCRQKQRATETPEQLAERRRKASASQARYLQRKREQARQERLADAHTPGSGAQGPAPWRAERSSLLGGTGSQCSTRLAHQPTRQTRLASRQVVTGRASPSKSATQGDLVPPAQPP